MLRFCCWNFTGATAKKLVISKSFDFERFWAENQEAIKGALHSAADRLLERKHEPDSELLTLVVTLHDASGNVGTAVYPEEFDLEDYISEPETEESEESGSQDD